MLTDYTTAAMRHTHYEFLKEGKVFYGEIPKLQGIIALSPACVPQAGILGFIP